VQYVVDGNTYFKRKWIGAGEPVPEVGSSRTVLYAANKPQKAKVLWPSPQLPMKYSLTGIWYISFSEMWYIAITIWYMPQGAYHCKKRFANHCEPFFFLHIFEENISQAKPISYGISRISPICKANWFHCWLVISLWPTNERRRLSALAGWDRNISKAYNRIKIISNFTITAFFVALIFLFRRKRARSACRC